MRLLVQHPVGGALVRAETPVQHAGQPAIEKCNLTPHISMFDTILLKFSGNLAHQRRPLPLYPLTALVVNLNILRQSLNLPVP